MPRELLTELPTKPSFEDFRRYDGTLYVRNHSNKAISANTREHRFLLNPAGSPGDCQPMPEHAFKLANVQKMWMRGQISISPDYGDYSMQGWNKEDVARKQAMDAIEEMTEENSTDDDLVQKECLVCSSMMFQTVADEKALVPPLCDNDKYRETDFIGTQVQNGNGTPEVKFTLAPNYRS